MTEQDFLALKPRERDALVAEKVMGNSPCLEWRLLHHGGLSGPAYGLDGGHCSEHGGPPSTCVPSHLFPHHYTEDIGLTWQVVEKMREEGFSFRIEISGLIWFAIFGAGRDTEAANNLAPLAITIAALRARGVIET